MSKIIETGSDSRTKLLSGVEQLADAVVTTLGPNGRNVVIAQQGGMLPQSTKDGVTVAKTVTLKDPVENLGAQMVKQAAVQTGDIAGDGTTTSTLLAKELIAEGMNHLSQKHNAVVIKRDLFCVETLSKIGNNSLTCVILPSYNKIYGSSNCACIDELSVTK